MFDRMRAIYPAISSAVAASWIPLAVGLAAVAILFRLQSGS